MTYSTEALPTWALCYLINSDPSGLTDEEIEMVDNWCKDNNVSVVCTASDQEREKRCKVSAKSSSLDFAEPQPVFAERQSEPYFTHYPAFGLPCDVIDCNVIIY